MTLAKRVIPCLDVTGGRVVKGVAFVDLRDAGDPADGGDDAVRRLWGLLKSSQSCQHG